MITSISSISSSIAIMAIKKRLAAGHKVEIPSLGITIEDQQTIRQLNYDGMWALEHSQYLEDNSGYPWHISPLKEAIEGNQRDCTYNERKANKWQIVFIGPDMESCAEVCDKWIESKQKEVLMADELSEQVIKSFDGDSGWPHFVDPGLMTK